MEQDRVKLQLTVGDKSLDGWAQHLGGAWKVGSLMFPEVLAVRMELTDAKRAIERELAHHVRDLVARRAKPTRRARQERMI